jgi:hypothetical protein
MDPQKYIVGLIHILCKILAEQAANGIAIIKIHHIFYKPIVEILFILTSMYEKVYIIKPNNSNIYYNERYIVCKNFFLRRHLYQEYFLQLNQSRHPRFCIASLLKTDVPYFFTNKIEESNIIIGHQQLEYMTHVISLFKNKNREEKLEIIKKNNIQKCIQWCEKFKIPYNKFTDKVNIFLPLTEGE